MYLRIGDLIENRQLAYSDFRQMLNKRLIRHLFIASFKGEFERVDSLDGLIERWKQEAIASERESFKRRIDYFKSYWLRDYRDPLRQMRREIWESDAYDAADKPFAWEKYLERWRKAKDNDYNLQSSITGLRNEKEHYKREVAKIQATIEGSTISSIYCYRQEFEAACSALVSERLAAGTKNAAKKAGGKKAGALS